MIKYAFGMGKRMDKLAKSFRKDYADMASTKAFYEAERDE
jgi:hypothetical protein